MPARASPARLVSRGVSEHDARRRPRRRARSGSGTIAGIDVLVALLVVPRRRADRVRDGPADRGGRGRASAAGSTSPGVGVRGAALPLGAAARGVARARRRAHYGLPVNSISLHFLGGATEIDGEPRRRPAGVRDRGGRAADLAAWSVPSRSASGRHPRRSARARGQRPGPREPRRRRAQPGARAAARRRSGAQGGGLGVTGDPHRGMVVAAWGGRVAARARDRLAADQRARRHSTRRSSTTWWPS